ncbi:hypothetical protein GLAREA_10660 [Glarea lozoyensis ATCC 20868]|uniref:Secreted protein n=1 Tax=Glarea lozoyensis (strain ATCC 20868 / MF5171) TaxID=1116229 RepID=S3DB45_GLAL2|nr:uncharacterized protein GLAREA_10660 [Glarea lozoyensis ATCC 20868]EPE34965.1 hypothetical protein GLAREA_10660 [Glarea lozoyensis ATCC 20868]
MVHYFLIYTLIFLKCISALTPPPENFTLTSITYAGTGCPAGSIAARLSPDRTKLILSTDGFAVQSGDPTYPASALRKICQVSIAHDYPTTHQYRIVAPKITGLINISKNVNATTNFAVYYPAFDSPIPAFKATIEGPTYGLTEWNLTQSQPEWPESGWSPCGGPSARTLNLNVQNRLYVKNVTVDEGRAEIYTFLFDLEWRNEYCHS